VPSDVAAGIAGRGDGDAGLDGDLVGVRSAGDLDGLTGMGQANLDLLAADHDRPADREPPGDDQGFGQLGLLGGAGAGAAEPGAGLGRDGAADGADDDACGQDVGDRAVQAQAKPPPSEFSGPRSGLVTVTGASLCRVGAEQGLAVAAAEQV
jgi:hypothetical protein